MMTILTLFLALSTALPGAHSDASDRAITVHGGIAWGQVAMEEIAREASHHTRKGTGETGVNIDRWDDERNIEKFCSNDCMVLYHRAFPTDAESKLLAEHFSSDATKPEIFCVGFAQVAVIVNRANSLRNLSLAQILDLLKMESGVERWPQVRGSGGTIRRYGEKRNSTSREVIRHACMMLGPEWPTGYYRYREDFEQCADAEEVVKKVRADRNGIGFVLYRGQPLKDVKVVAISRDAQSKATSIDVAALTPKKYPLSEPLVVYLRPNAPTIGRELCEFAVGPEGAKILKKLGIIPDYELKMARSKLRAEEAKKGHGQTIHFVGIADAEGLAKELALRYVEAKQAVRLKYQKERTSADAIASVKGSNAELLLIARKTTAKRETPGRNEQFVLGSVALGVIVHPKLGLESLSVAELRQICGGEIQEWPGVSGKEAVIRGYGLAKNAAVMEVLGDVVSGKWQVASAGRWIEDRESRLEDGEVRERVAGKEGTLAPRASSLAPLKLARCEDTAEVILSVARDPAGIGFVDLSQMPKSDGSVQLVPIMLADGTATQVASQRVSEDYPLQVPYTLYLSPQAGEAAKNFFTWLSETPNDAILLKHGLLPARQTK